MCCLVSKNSKYNQTKKSDRLLLTLQKIIKFSIKNKRISSITLLEKKIMKNIKKTMLYFAVIIPAVFFSRCTLTEDISSIKKSVDSLQIVVGTPKFNTNIHFEFVDAKTGLFIKNSDVSVVVSGKDASSIYNNIGQKKSSYASKMGFVDLVVDPHKVDSVAIQTTPIEFVVSASVNGYLSASQKVAINKASRQNFRIKLIKMDSAPEGVSVAVNNSFAVSGSDGKIQNSSTQSLNTGKQTIVIPKDVVLKDANGTPVTGTLKSEIVFFDPASPTAQNAIPGSLAVEAKLSDGTSGNIQFASAGMFNVKLTAGDKTVKSFENGGMAIKTVLPANMINPKTGVAVKENDVIEMWSIDEGSGKWIFEKMDTVRKVNGDLVLEETIKHLSSWNWDWWIPSCDNGPKFVFKGNLTSNNLVANVNAKYKYYGYEMSEDNQITVSTTGANSYLEIQRPAQSAGTFTFENSTSNNSSGTELVFTPSTVDVTNMCEGKTYEIQVSEKKIIETVKVNVELSATSTSNKNLVLMPNTWVYFFPTSITSLAEINTSEMTNGKSAFSLELDKEYYIGALFGSSWGMGTIKVQNEGTSSYRLTFTPIIDFSTAQTSTPISYVLPKDATKSVTVKYAGVLSDEIFNSLK